ncbi:MAG: hypothetical protein M3Z03_10320 [Actinomycetota bacterium]|nr:hypothetical protein [Actinomycetota bacterium]
MGPDTAAAPSFDELFVDARPRLLRLAHLLTGSAALAEEVVQEAFVVLHQRHHAVDDRAAYLRGVVVNLARKTQRRRGVEQRHAARRGPVPVVLPPELDETWRLVRALPPDQRAVVVLRFYEDLPLAVIATTLDKPIGTVKSLLHRALRRLAKELHP